MSARWGTASNLIPFSPSMFITPTPEQERKRKENAAKMEAFNQRTMAAQLTQLAAELKKQNANNPKQCIRKVQARRTRRAKRRRKGSS